jgi:NhaA family Na+:H+ antiporter
MATHHDPDTEPPIDPRFDAPLERVFDRIVTPFEEFIHNETASGLLLMGCAALALLVANSPLLEGYHHLLHTSVALHVGGWSISKTIHHWINDGLMTLFFILVGLEIKREILVGELSEPRQAALPIIAAVGGMAVPALFYLAANTGTPTIKGWGIPMATDIAFAVGAMVLLGKRIPRTLLTFLVALAIVDDLGGVMVIAVFYTENIALDALAVAAALFGLMVAFNRVGIRKPLPYFVVGTFLWLAMLRSGVHATLAGVLTALVIPARPKFDPERFSGHIRRLMDRFDAHHRPGASIMTNETQRSIVQTLENGVHLVETPLQRLEHAMHIPVGFVVVPIFALANAGIPVDMTKLAATLAHPVTLGVMLGLLLGKPLGIAGFSWLALKLGVGRLPAGVGFRHVVGVGILGGIGFTMSIFIAELGFAGAPDDLLMAKTGILFASALAGVIGFFWLLLASRR